MALRRLEFFDAIVKSLNIKQTDQLKKNVNLINNEEPRKIQIIKHLKQLFVNKIYIYWHLTYIFHIQTCIYILE